MHLRDYLDPALIFTGLAPVDKQTLLDELATRMAGQLPLVAQEALLARLRAREKESSTGVGQGVAIPHCFLEELDQSRCILAQVPQGVAFDAIDEEPVHLLFVLLSPPSARMTHLRLLARISRIASRQGFVAEAMAAATPDALHELIVREDHSHAG
jgi:mannitol/fructose-specific phosphotransferase system IIA component (Ntr-type)